MLKIITKYLSWGKNLLQAYYFIIVNSQFVSRGCCLNIYQYMFIPDVLFSPRQVHRRSKLKKVKNTEKKYSIPNQRHVLMFPTEIKPSYIYI